MFLSCVGSFFRHSPGSMVIHIKRGNKDIALITGDTVFPGSCGRLDLPESEPHLMWERSERKKERNENKQEERNPSK